MEFANDELGKLGNQFGMTIKYTAAYYPWVNGLNECNYASNDSMMEKMLEDSPNFNGTLALNHTVFNRNCYSNVNDFKPASLAIGENPILPPPFQDHIPFLERCTTSPTIAKHLNDPTAAHEVSTNIEIKINTTL